MSTKRVKHSCWEFCFVFSDRPSFYLSFARFLVKQLIRQSYYFITSRTGTRDAASDVVTPPNELCFALCLWNTLARRRRRRSADAQIQTTKSRHGKTTLALGCWTPRLLQVCAESVDSKQIMYYLVLQLLNYCYKTIKWNKTTLLTIVSRIFIIVIFLLILFSRQEVGPYCFYLSIYVSII